MMPILLNSVLNKIDKLPYWIEVSYLSIYKHDTSILSNRLVTAGYLPMIWLKRTYNEEKSTA